VTQKAVIMRHEAPKTPMSSELGVGCERCVSATVRTDKIRRMHDNAQYIRPKPLVSMTVLYFIIGLCLGMGRFGLLAFLVLGIFLWILIVLRPILNARHRQ
jgi:hypothetical protein